MQLSTTTATESPYLDRQQAAQYLNVSPSWLAQHGRQAVPHYKFGGKCQYRRDELDNWVRQQRVAR